MKTLRKSRSIETRMGHRAMVARGRASLSRSALLEPAVVLTGRRFRRANGLTRAEVAIWNELVRRPDGTSILPTATVGTDKRTLQVTGFRLTMT